MKNSSATVAAALMPKTGIKLQQEIVVPPPLFSLNIFRITLKNWQGKYRYCNSFFWLSSFVLFSKIATSPPPPPTPFLSLIIRDGNPNPNPGSGIWNPPVFHHWNPNPESAILGPDSGFQCFSQYKYFNFKCGIYFM